MAEDLNYTIFRSSVSYKITGSCCALKGDPMAAQNTYYFSESVHFLLQFSKLPIYNLLYNLFAFCLHKE